MFTQYMWFQRVEGKQPKRKKNAAKATKILKNKSEKAAKAEIKKTRNKIQLGAKKREKADKKAAEEAAEEAAETERILKANLAKAKREKEEAEAAKAAKAVRDAARKADTDARKADTDARNARKKARNATKDREEITYLSACNMTLRQNSDEISKLAGVEHAKRPDGKSRMTHYVVKDGDNIITDSSGGTIKFSNIRGKDYIKTLHMQKREQKKRLGLHDKAIKAREDFVAKIRAQVGNPYFMKSMENPEFREKQFHSNFEIHHCIDGILLQAYKYVRGDVQTYFDILNKIHQCQTKHKQGNIVDSSSLLVFGIFLSNQISLLEKCGALMQVVQLHGWDSYYGSNWLNNRVRLRKKLLANFRRLQGRIQALVELWSHEDGRDDSSEEGKGD